MEWYRNLWIVLYVEDKLPFLEQPIPAMPVPPAGQVLPPGVLNTHTAWVKALKEIAGLMLMTMDPDIQKNLKQLGAYDMLKELKTLYAQQAYQELLQTVENFTHANKKKDSLSLEKELSRLSRRVDEKKKLSQGASTSGPRGSRKLKPGALSLYVGDGHRAAVEAIGEFHLCLPSGLDGFVNRFENDNSISVSRNNLVYFNAISRDDIYEIDLSSSNTNDSSMYVVCNKRAKLNLDSALLWHCRLGHISKKRIEKLQHKSSRFNRTIKSFEKFSSLHVRKMARKPYSHQVERAKDLL
ncbi:retrotransposon protein, putative, ty1-copia subclass [Tanacetum coccineum]|uniref:Retrotransposon protein, putative, ty1-copia subclass n=1 Tax=Tanacetum coccineum TaxID=301880 RepID=A0ABQ4ZA87_9ASTR